MSPDAGSQDQIEVIMHAELRRSGYRALCDVTFRHCNGVISVVGQVPTFHQKQVALALVHRTCADLCIDDQLTVVPERRTDQASTWVDPRQPPA